MSKNACVRRMNCLFGFKISGGFPFLMALKYNTVCSIQLAVSFNISMITFKGLSIPFVCYSVD